VPNERETLKRQIDQYLKSLAPDVWFRKNWGGGVYGHSGDSDWVVCVRGRFVFIEAKHPVKKPKLEADQKFTQENVRRAGGFTIEATDVSDVVVSLSRLRREGPAYG
jgi:hypothetical protein